MNYQRLLPVLTAVMITVGTAGISYGEEANDSTLIITAQTSGSFEEEEPEEASDSAAEQVSLAEKLSGRSLDQEVFKARYRAGKYTAGSTIPVGEYMLFAYGDESFVRVGTTTDSSYTVTSASFTYNHIIVFSENQSITMSGCYAVPINQVRPEKLKRGGPGMYKIGMHIAAGNYTLEPSGENASYVIYNTVSPEKIDSSSELTANTTVRVSAGQYIDLKNCRFSKIPDPVQITYTDKDTIRRVQAQLNMIDYNCGNPDGVLGGKTAAAIKKYQEDHNLTVNGKITAEFLVSLDIESPYSEVESELGPFILDSSAFASRYSEAAKKAAETESGRYASVSADDIKKGTVTPNKAGSCVFETNKEALKIKSVFYIPQKSFDRKAVIELSLMMYAVDTSFKDFDSAENAALRLLFDGSLETSALSFSILDLHGSTVAWVQLK